MSSNNPARDNVFKKIDELIDAVRRDNYDLNRNQQDMIEFNVLSLRKLIEDEYGKCQRIS